MPQQINYVDNLVNVIIIIVHVFSFVYTIISISNRHLFYMEFDNDEKINRSMGIFHICINNKCESHIETKGKYIKYLYLKNNNRFFNFYSNIFNTMYIKCICLANFNNAIIMRRAIKETYYFN